MTHVHRIVVATALVVAAGTPSPAAADVHATVTLRNNQLLVVGTDRNDSIGLRPGRRPGTLELVFDGRVHRFRAARAQSVALIGRAGDDVLAVDPALSVPVLLEGDAGHDVLTGGDGGDTAVWNPGDGSDVVHGAGGHDILVFNGADAPENIALAAAGGTLHLVRDLGGVTMDADGVERVRLAVKGGQDRVTVGDLAGTGVDMVDADLAAADGAPDPAQDAVTVQGGPQADAIDVVGTTALTTVGAAAVVRVVRSDRSDALAIDAAGGNDTINASLAPSELAQLTLTGGPGADNVEGSHGNDILTWAPGDGSDSFGGGTGIDVMAFRGSNGSETVTVTPDEREVVFTREPGAIVMHLDSVERIAFIALGGQDTVTVGDLTGTAATDVIADLGAGAGPDLLADSVTVTGTAGVDHIGLSAGDDFVAASGLAATVTVVHPDPQLDLLRINTQEGDDVVDTSALPAGHIGLEVH